MLVAIIALVASSSPRVLMCNSAGHVCFELRWMQPRALVRRSSGDARNRQKIILNKLSRNRKRIYVRRARRQTKTVEWPIWNSEVAWGVSVFVFPFLLRVLSVCISGIVSSCRFEHRYDGCVTALAGNGQSAVVTLNTHTHTQTHIAKPNGQHER